MEQNANLALQTADRGYVLEAGGIKLQGPITDLLQADRRVKPARQANHFCEVPDRSFAGGWKEFG